MYIIAVYGFFFFVLVFLFPIYANIKICAICEIRCTHHARLSIAGARCLPAGMVHGFLAGAEKETKTETLPPCLTIRRLWGEQEETCVTALVVRVLRWVSWEGDEPIYVALGGTAGCGTSQSSSRSGCHVAKAMVRCAESRRVSCRKKAKRATKSLE